MHSPSVKEIKRLNSVNICNRSVQNLSSDLLPKNIQIACRMTHAFNNSIPNIQLKFSTTKETENIIKSLTSKDMCGYDEIFTKLLKMSCVYVTSSLNHVSNTSI
jgi:hypothetical protein